MNEWFYATGGQQKGPVTYEQLVEIARSGGLDPTHDLVWNASMPEWVPAGRVTELFAALPPAPPASPLEADNPYAAPQSPVMVSAPESSGPLQEIVPGSEPIVPTECVQRGFDLTKRNFLMIFLVGLVYFGIQMLMSVVAGVLEGGGSMLAGQTGFETEADVRAQFTTGITVAWIITNLISQVISIYLGLGLTRVALNLMSGNAVTIGQLFGEGDKLLRAIGATILYSLMLIVGFLLLIVPGIYLALRYGQYMTAIVDKNLGVMESLQYSSTLTTNNRMNLFVLGLLCFLVTLAGVLLCGVGLIFAGPVAWLAWVSAYWWMRFGRRAVQDQPESGNAPGLSVR